MTGAELARAGHTKLDAAFTALLEKARVEKGEHPPCRAGCSWCCIEPVYASRQEVEAIAEAIATMPPDEQARIHAEIKSVVAKFSASPLIREKEPSAVAYRKLRLWCPLLKGTLCSVYADRPMGCRTHVARKDARGCEDDELRKHQEFLLPPPELLSVGMIETFLAGTEMDHLILLLHRYLFGSGPKSGAWVRVVVKDTAVWEDTETK